jgi:ElaB/YqjD/DUF883 family membrane-anchored ribosome-binding protein
MKRETERLVNDLRVVARDAEDLIRSTAGDLSAKAKEARARLSTALESARESCERLQDKAIEGGKAVDRVVHEKPYVSLGVALAVGVLIGILVNRDRD